MTKPQLEAIKSATFAVTSSHCHDQANTPGPTHYSSPRQRLITARITYTEKLGLARTAEDKDGRAHSATVQDGKHLDDARRLSDKAVMKPG